jgi:aminoglycoside/choline kinase family phosphotransferase
MTDTSLPNDERVKQLRHWLLSVMDAPDWRLSAASIDASFRRYFRVHAAQQTFIAMDAPPAQEDSAAFIKVAGLLADAGLHTPAILASDLDRGFLLLEDLGDQTYLQVLDDDNADALFDDAINALVRMQAAGRPGAVPDYAADDLRREMRLFPQWYVGRELGRELSADDSACMEAAFDRIIAALASQARVLVHRDYMPRNLMVCHPNPGVIDFQDARYGPISYDLLSLFRDAFISWPEARIDAWNRRYWTRARDAGLPVPETFEAFDQDLKWMGLQRHLKVIGIFARICHRDGKPHYLRDVPRFAGYIRPVLHALPGMADFAELFDRLMPPEAPAR